MKKTCNVCNIEKDISSFEWQKNRPNPRKTCKLCKSRNTNHSEKSIQNKKNYKKKYRESGRARKVWERHKYGISKEDINYSKCLLCGSENNLHIDHCHKTSRFRGLLCGNCNTGLGMFKENIETMQKAINYINYFNNPDNSGFVDKPHFELVIS